MPGPVEAHKEERIASPEAHERVLLDVLKRLRDSEYFHDADSAELVFPDEATVAEWEGYAGWPEGMGKAVAKCNVVTVMVAGGEEKDKLSAELLAAGYLIDLYPDMEKTTGTSIGDTAALKYYIYEKP